ncbi:MAG: hypothetical protein LUB59_02450, partial [Candidatus Gastranaerophilales bacterium]|nr:hypothetical protein [Candidatus Gastranaerophilales bacterium]
CVVINCRCKMTISFGNSEIGQPAAAGFAERKPIVCTQDCPQCAAKETLKEDVADISTKKRKTSLWQKIKNGYTSIKKGFITASEYFKGTLKGLIYGGAVGLAVLGADAVRGIVKKSPKTVSTKGKIIAGLAGASVMAYNLFNANLNANEKKANVDHRWQTGHNKD